MTYSSKTAVTAAQLREQIARLGGLVDDSRGPRTLQSGYAELDEHLPGGGWPVGALTELLSDTTGIGELSLLLPALSRLACGGRHIIWIAPPYLPYAPALARYEVPLERVLLIHSERPQDALWAAEQALRCPAVGAVLCWSAHIVERSVRRLQLAAETGGTLGILHRPVEAAHEPSPAALRLWLAATATGLKLEIRKARGGRAGLKVQITTIHEARADCDQTRIDRSEARACRSRRSS